MSKEEYQLKGNDILKDSCNLNRWFQMFKERSRGFNNPLNNLLPTFPFRRVEDRDKLKLIEQKTKEIIDIYRNLFETFKKSLSKEDIKNLW